jgi:aryl-alcohol dehydrogenase-like predicted oxidoreductase
MKKRQLGKQGLIFSELGLGCMPLSWAVYGAIPDESASVSVIHHALELGINFLDTAELYGPYTNESLVGKAIQGKPRDQIIIATKFGFKWDAQGKITGVNSNPLHIRESIEGSLKRLNTDYIDLYYQHRLDPNTPIEDTMQVLAEFVKAGKVRYIGLSEVGPATLRRAHAVHPITALQSEYSFSERNVEEKILPVLRELGIGFVPYSPLGRGFLTGKIKNPDQLDAADFRKATPRFQDENFKHNLQFVEKIKAFSTLHHVTPAQLALAWLLHQGDDIVPIPATKHIQHLEENVKAAEVHLSQDAWHELHQLLDDFHFQGERYPASAMQLIDRKE